MDDRDLHSLDVHAVRNNNVHAFILDRDFIHMDRDLHSLDIHAFRNNNVHAFILDRDFIHMDRDLHSLDVHAFSDNNVHIIYYKQNFHINIINIHLENRNLNEFDIRDGNHKNSNNPDHSDDHERDEQYKDVYDLSDGADARFGGASCSRSW
jgi:hypothetical protein